METILTDELTLPVFCVPKKPKAVFGIIFPIYIRSLDNIFFMQKFELEFINNWHWEILVQISDDIATRYWLGTRFTRKKRINGSRHKSPRRTKRVNVSNSLTNTYRYQSCMFGWQVLSGKIKMKKMHNDKFSNFHFSFYQFGVRIYNTNKVILWCQNWIASSLADEYFSCTLKWVCKV